MQWRERAAGFAAATGVSRETLERLEGYAALLAKCGGMPSAQAGSKNDQAKPQPSHDGIR